MGVIFHKEPFGGHHLGGDSCPPTFDMVFCQSSQPGRHMSGQRSILAHSKLRRAQRRAEGMQ